VATAPSAAKTTDREGAILRKAIGENGKKIFKGRGPRFESSWVPEIFD
jgi:hypothetical protein